jgi:glycosyltransferase involved in cell wall biosynthesis
MLRWHSHLLKAGVESRVLCFQKSADNPEVFSPSVPPDRIEATKSRATQERWIDDCRTSFSDNFFSQPFFANRLLCEELADWADVLHLHWISRALNLSNLVDLAAVGKPLVLTPHDLWSVTGGCHYPAGCQQFRESCRVCPMVTEDSQPFVEISHRLKRAIFSQTLSALVCPSAWIQKEIAGCQEFAAIQSFVIPYSYDSTEFWPEDKAIARSTLGIPSDCTWLLFIADRLSETRKGFTHFLQLLQRTEERMRALGREKSFAVLIAGQGEDISEIDLGVPVIRLGFLSGASQLRLAYSSADLLIYMGLEDNLPNVITEALACGTPVLGYATGGVVDQVRSGENGILVPSGDLKGATNALEELLLAPHRIEELADRANKTDEKSYANQRIVGDLISMYQKVASDPKPKMPQPGSNAEYAEYENFAVCALAELLEKAEKRSSQLKGEVNWLREFIAKMSSPPGSLE